MQRNYVLQRHILFIFSLIGKKQDKYLEFLLGGEAWPHKGAVRPAQLSDLLLLLIRRNCAQLVSS